MDLPRISRDISLILRHKPWVAGITLDHHGWADVEELLAGVSKKYPIDKGILEEIVRTDNKQRKQCCSYRYHHRSSCCSCSSCCSYHRSKEEQEEILLRSPLNTTG